ncbi:hypothetical protein [Inhella inkyongensis]|uniref:hypothetical protein n=1 Tax=Inhella inkyongensis TaxID=392593 RepID=UPI001C849AAC|nr:hypothetical protein [Inhella inkyongensis]
MSRFAWAGLLACLLTPAVRATTVPLQWGEQRRFEMERTLPAGGRLEVCGPVTPAEPVDWTFHADGVLAFSILHRLGHRSLVSERRQRVKALQGKFKAEQAYPHCWVWINRGQQPVRLALMLRY